MALPTAPFGRTGHQSSRTIFGAAALGGIHQAGANRALDAALAAGINHIDTAASYGEAEDRLKPWLTEHRSKVFLATKTGERTASLATAEFERSLERMGVEQVDLLQLHNLVDEDEWQTAMSPGGALEAATAARDQGLVRFIGVTGHGTAVVRQHLRSLEEFEFDSVLFPYNFTMLADPDYRDGTEALLTLCAERNVAVQTIKSLARRRWRTEPDKMFSWYEPITEPDAVSRAVRYVLSNSQLFLNTSSDLQLLAPILAAAQGDLSAPSDAEMASDRESLGLEALFDELNPV